MKYKNEVTEAVSASLKSMRLSEIKEGCFCFLGSVVDVSLLRNNFFIFCLI